MLICAIPMTSSFSNRTLQPTPPHTPLPPQTRTKTCTRARVTQRPLRQTPIYESFPEIIPGTQIVKKKRTKAAWYVGLAVHEEMEMAVLAADKGDFLIRLDEKKQFYGFCINDNNKATHNMKITVNKEDNKLVFAGLVFDTLEDCTDYSYAIRRDAMRFSFVHILWSFFFPPLSLWGLFFFQRKKKKRGEDGAFATRLFYDVAIAGLLPYHASDKQHHAIQYHNLTIPNAIHAIEGVEHLRRNPVTTRSGSMVRLGTRTHTHAHAHARTRTHAHARTQLYF